jgi:disease resistance protein RPM1
MKSLRTLQTFDLSGCSVGKVKSLGELTNLRNLQLCCCSYPLEDEVMDAPCSSLEKLSHSSTLKNLAIINPWFPYFHIDGLSTLSSFPRYLGKLDLKDCLFSRIPRWIAHLQNLDSLKLAVSEVVPKDDVHILAGMPSLVYLYLDTIVEHPQERFIFPGNGKAFPALRQLKFRRPKLFMAFEAGALPRLRKLELWFSAKGWEQGGDKWVPIGIEHLPTSLEEILVERNLDLADDCDVDLAGAALKSLFDTYHPHYRRTVIPRVPGTSPRAKNRALGEANLPRVLHSGKNCTRGRWSSPSA